MSLTGENLARLLELATGLHEGTADRARMPPPAGAISAPRTLTVGIPTRGDVEGVYVTLAALRLAHAEALEDVTFLVVDTDPERTSAWSLKALEWEISGLRYVPAGDVNGSAAAKDRVLRESSSEWVLYLEPHVLLAPRALAGLVAFVRANPECTDLLQGPLLHDDLSQVWTHWDPLWRDGRFGVAAYDARGAVADGEPFDIPMQSLALFACRRSAWPGVNARLRSTGHEEGYVHDKFRRSGARTLCAPFLRWAHRSSRPTSVLGRAKWRERLRNYLVEWTEHDLPTEPVVEHFSAIHGTPAVSLVHAQWESEQANPFLAFDGIFCINLDSRPDRWKRMSERFEQLGIAADVRRIAGVATANSHVGCALSHRKALEIAHEEGMETVLVLEDDTVFLDGARWVLRRALDELATEDWRLLYLGSFPSLPYPLVDGCHHLEVVNGLMGAHAVVYHRRLYEELLVEMPADIAGMAEWSRRHPIDKFFATTLTDGVFRVSPMIASQEVFVPKMPVDLRDMFVLDTSTDWKAQGADANGTRRHVSPSPPLEQRRSVPARVTSRPDPRVAPAGARSTRVPTVTAVMATGHDERRRPLARLTARAFAQQTYQAAELLIVNQGRTPLFEEPVERVREIVDGEGLVIGALRNLAWRYATGDLMTCWDDDDVHDAERIAHQVAAYDGSPVALQSELVLHLRKGTGFAFRRGDGFPNSLLWPRDCSSRYTDKPQRSDTHFFNRLTEEMGGITTLDNAPSLYVRLFHGRNIWDEDHIVHLPHRLATKFDAAQVTPLTPDQRLLLDQVLDSHRDVAPWNIAGEGEAEAVPSRG